MTVSRLYSDQQTPPYCKAPAVSRFPGLFTSEGLEKIYFFSAPFCWEDGQIGRAEDALIKHCFATVAAAPPEGISPSSFHYIPTLQRID